MSNDLPDRIAVTRDQAADLIGLSKETIVRAIHANELVEHYVSAKPVILVKDLIAWIEAAPTENPRTSRYR